MSFAPRSFHVAPGPSGTAAVQVATVVSGADARALESAVAWQRTTDFLAPSVESAEQLLALRALQSLADVLGTLSADGGPVSLDAGQVALLAEAASRYVAQRDVDGHQPAPERERIAKLRELTGPLFDTVADLAGAEQELAAQRRS
jgi:hypothetical protein